MIEPALASIAAAGATLFALAAVLSSRRAMVLATFDSLRSGRSTLFWPPVARRWLDRAPLVGSRRLARRRAAFDSEVPQLLDLLAAASLAGLSAPLALRRAGEALRGPLGGEIGTVFDAVDLGARWRDELGGVADRWRSADLRRAVTVLVRTEVVGSSLSDATRELAASVRQARRAERGEQARTAPVKMLFPLVLLVLPAFLLLTVVPVLLTTVRSIG